MIIVNETLIVSGCFTELIGIGFAGIILLRICIRLFEILLIKLEFSEADCSSILSCLVIVNLQGNRCNVISLCILGQFCIATLLLNGEREFIAVFKCTVRDLLYKIQFLRFIRFGIVKHGQIVGNRIAQSSPVSISICPVRVISRFVKCLIILYWARHTNLLGRSIFLYIDSSIVSLTRCCVFIFVGSAVIYTGLLDSVHNPTRRIVRQLDIGEFNGGCTIRLLFSNRFPFLSVVIISFQREIELFRSDRIVTIHCLPGNDVDLMYIRHFLVDTMPLSILILYGTSGNNPSGRRRTHVISANSNIAIRRQYDTQHGADIDLASLVAVPDYGLCYFIFRFVSGRL